MNTVYLTACIGFFASIYFARRYRSRTKDGAAKSILPHYLLYAMAGVLLGALLGAFVASTVVRGFVPRRDVVYGPATLVAMRSGDGISGAFLWGAGNVSSTVVYHFYQRNADGSLTPGQVNASQMVYIKEDKNLKDVGYWRTTMSEIDVSAPIALWALDLNTFARDGRVVKEEFLVPVGTVVQTFSVN